VGVVARHLEVSVSQMAVLALRGEIDIAGLDDLKSAIEPHLALGQTIVLDLSDVTFADSTLLNILYQSLGKANDGGGALLVRNPSDGVRKLLSLVGLDGLVQAEVARQNDPSRKAPPRP
jgi:anti-anti-sigma factor